MMPLLRLLRHGPLPMVTQMNNRTATGIVILAALLVMLAWHAAPVDWVVEYSTYGCKAPTIWTCEGDALYLAEGEVVRVEGCRVAWDEVDKKWRVFAIVDGHYFSGLSSACW